MKKLKWAKKLVACTLLVATLVTSMPLVEAFALHGTSAEVITKDMLTTKAPTDYVIPEEMQADAKDGLYSEYFLKDSLQTVSITIDENNMNYLLQNAVDEPNVMTTSVTIGDQTIGYAGLKTKGNYTKIATDATTSDRFSFTINFGKFVTKKTHGAKQNFYGLAKVSFNNLYFDKIAMKEYCALKLMDEMGIPTPEYGVAKLYINDEYYGVYFMVEAVDSTIMERYLQTDDVSDYLLKTEGTNFQYDVALDEYKDENGEFTLESLSSVLYENEDGDYVADGVLANSSALWESDDDTLQDVAELLPTVLTWQDKLNLLSQGKDFEGNAIDVNSTEYEKLLEEIMDVDEVLRYFAVHSFIIQQDNMFDNFQNYALYISEEGKSMIVPWDYDLSWGNYYDPYDAEGVANWDLDVMYSQYFCGYGDMTTEEVYSQFPLINVLYQNDKLWNRYYEYMEDCAKIAAIGGKTTDGRIFEAGRFAEIIDILKPQLIEAASEPMPDRVYYLNGVVQPYAMINGLDDFKNLVAMRSVGVWLQKNNVNSIVTGSGADIAKLGNNMTGKYFVSGTLTTVDAETGIFATANYSEEGNVGPRLDVAVLDDTNEVYNEIKDKLKIKNDEDIIVYQMTDAKEAESAYQLYIPTSAGIDSKDSRLYTYEDGEFTQLVVKKEKDLYKVKADDISYVVIAKVGKELNATPDFAKRHALKKEPTWRLCSGLEWKQEFGNGHKQEEKVIIYQQSKKEAYEEIPYVENTTYIVGNEDMSTLWWSAHSENYEIPTNSTTVIEFENYSAEVDVWDNFVTVFTNEAATYGLEQTPGYYQEYAVVRADDFGWGTLGGTLTYANTYEGDVAKFQEILKAANVTMTITRNSSYVTINEVVTSIEDPSMSYERTVTFEAPKGDLFATLTIEGGYLKVNSITQEKHTSYIVGKEDMSTVWWDAFSEHYALEADSTTVIEFENHSAEVDVWDNFVSVFTNEAATHMVEQSTDYVEYAVVRADDFGWGTMGHTLTYANTYEGDLAKFQEILKDANVTMTITREGSMVTIHENVVSMNDATNSYERTVTFEATEGDLFVTLTVEGGYLKINSVTAE